MLFSECTLCKKKSHIPIQKGQAKGMFNNFLFIYNERLGFGGQIKGVFEERWAPLCVLVFGILPQGGNTLHSLVQLKTRSVSQKCHNNQMSLSDELPSAL